MTRGKQLFLAMGLILTLIFSTGLACAGDGALDPNFNPGLGVSNIPLLWSPTYYTDGSGKMIIGGDFTTVEGVNRNGVARLNADGGLDTGFNAPITGMVFNVLLLNQGSPDSQMLIAGDFSVPSTSGTYYGLARLNANGSVDPTFTHTFNPGKGVQFFGLLSDGKIMVGGYAMSVAGYPDQTYYLLRLSANGAVDTGYPMRSAPGSYVRGLTTYPTDPTYPNSVRLWGTIDRFTDPTHSHCDRMQYLASNGTTVLASIGDEYVNGPILAMSWQGDGKPIIVGSFTQVYGAPRNGVARLLATGGLDDTFTIGSGANSYVQRVNLDSGKVVLAGDFTSFNGTACGRMVRLTAGGSVDTTFGTGADDRIWTMFKRADNTWMILGAFQYYNGVPRHCIANLALDGTLNDQYSAVTMANTNPAAVYVIQDSPQGLLIGGDFTGYGGKYHSRVARVNFDGTPDASFTQGFDGVVKSISYDWQGVDGIMVAGDFGTGAGYAPLTGIARLNYDGTPDRTFKPIITKADGSMPELSLVQSGWDPGGHILVCGDFATVNGVARSSIARLNADGTLDTSLNFNPASMPGLTNIKINGADDDTGNPFIVAGKAIYSGATSGFFARLLHDGSLDTSFANGPSPVPHVVVFNGEVTCGTGDETGQATLGGEFTQILDGATNPPRNYIARFSPDGILDPTFAPSGPNGPVYALETQYTAQYTTNKVLIGGAFATYNGVARNNIARMKADGSLDTTFNPGAGANGPVLAIAWNDYINRARIGGAFNTYTGVSRPGLAQIVVSKSSFNPAIPLMLLLN